MDPQLSGHIGVKLKVVVAKMETAGQNPKNFAIEITFGRRIFLQVTYLSGFGNVKQKMKWDCSDNALSSLQIF